eukprot:scaffold37255_cov75-Phaeocystis_antarctica.AAC.2
MSHHTVHTRFTHGATHTRPRVPSHQQRQYSPPHNLDQASGDLGVRFDAPALQVSPRVWARSAKEALAHWAREHGDPPSRDAFASGGTRLAGWGATFRRGAARRARDTLDSGRDCPPSARVLMPCGDAPAKRRATDGRRACSDERRSQVRARRAREAAGQQGLPPRLRRQRGWDGARRSVAQATLRSIAPDVRGAAPTCHALLLPSHYVSLEPCVFRPAALGVGSPFGEAVVEGWGPPIEQLRRLGKHRAPKDKVMLLVNASRMIERRLNKIARLHVQQGGQSRHIGADEYFPVLVYAVLQANPPQLLSTISFISRFRNPEALRSLEGCYFTHFRAAVAFLETFEFEDHTAAEDVQRQLRDFAGRAEVHEGGEATVLTDAFALRAALDPLLAVRGSAETGIQVERGVENAERLPLGRTTKLPALGVRDERAAPRAG